MTITLIDEARYDAEMDATVLPALQACMTEGWMEPATVDWEGKALPKLERPGRLHYYRYDARTFDALREEGASGVFRGTIVISHGFTEFGRKYSEMVWYFLLAGYSVCVFEHRGHGHSAHDMSNPSLVWIDDWRRYVADFATFAQTVGREAADGGPMYLYCHSMGGGIGAAALERYPSLFGQAGLSGPTVAPAPSRAAGSATQWVPSVAPSSSTTVSMRLMRSRRGMRFGTIEDQQAMVKGVPSSTMRATSSGSASML